MASPSAHGGRSTVLVLAGVSRSALLTVLLVVGAAAAPSWTLAAPPPQEVPHVHRIGVLAPRPKAQVQAAWAPLAEALARAVPTCQFTVEALDYPGLEAAIAARRVDLVITNPSHYVQIRTRQPMSGVLATVIERGPGAGLPAMGGAIFVRSDRPDLATLPDLARARVAAIGVSSLGGYQAQAHELLRAGVPLPADDRLLLTGMPHDRAVEAVVDGRADAGFARTGTLEAMAAEGRLDLGRVRVLHQQEVPGFPYAVSTRLYPEWPVVALSHLEEEHARRIAAALLVMPRSTDRSDESGYVGFTVPADYGPVEALLRDLRLPPFDGAPNFEVRDVVQRYQRPFVALAGAGLLIAVLIAFLAVANRRLTRSRRQAAEAASTLAAVLRSASVGISKVRARRQVWCNRRLEELLGYSAAEMDGEPTRTFYPDQAAFERLGAEAYPVLAAGRTYVTEQQMLRKDGTLFWAHMRGAQVPGAGGEPESIWTFEDVTERRAAEAGLRQALAANEATTAELREALSKVKLLSGLIPICMYCHKIRTDQGFWNRLEVFISSHSEAQFSHGICPACLEREHPP